MTEDWLGLNDEAELAAKRPAAFIVGPPMGNEEIKAAEQMHLASQRDAQFIGAAEIVFTVEDEEGVERLPVDQAATWRAIMGWPEKGRFPTLAEVEQFQVARNNALHREHWERLRAAVIRDAENAEAAEKARTDKVVAGYVR
jgi:hypothetical protein